MTAVQPPGSGSSGTETAIPAPGRAVAQLILRSPLTLAAIAWLLLVVVVSIFARRLAPFDPLAQNLSHLLAPPSAQHWLGTDSLGRDVLSRLMFGGGQLLWGAAEATLVSVLVGVPAGLVAGYAGGAADTVVGWFADLTFAVPAFVLLVALAVIYPGNTVVLMAALGVVAAGGVARLVRNSARAVRGEAFVDAARIAGVKRRGIIVRHILPSVTAPVIVLAALNTGLGIMVLATLSFLGLGGSPETPSWGEMVYEASENIATDPWLLVPAGTVLALTLVSINLIASTARDAVPGAAAAALAARSRRRPADPADRSGSPDGPDGPDAPPAPGALLDVRGLAVGFRLGPLLQPVVEGVSFTLRPGRALGLVGESGCGKTVTALSVAGLLPGSGQVLAGRIGFDGTDLTGLGERALNRYRGRRIGFVSQDPMSALDPSFTVGSQLSEVVRHHARVSRSSARKRAAELLAEVGIPEPRTVARAFPHQLSGGMAQRVSIALALAGEPELLIADEPTTALDVTVQAAILDLLRGLIAVRGTALLLVTHDLGVVADICDEVAVMYAGQIVEQGAAADVLRRPRHPYTAGLLAATPTVDADGDRLAAIPGMVPAARDWPLGCRFADRCPLATAACRQAPVALHPAGPERRVSRCIRVQELAEGVPG